MAHQKPNNCFLYTVIRENVQEHPALHILVKHQTVQINKRTKKIFWYKITLEIPQNYLQCKHRKIDGQKELENFLLPRSSKSLSALLENTWKMKDATAMLERGNLLCME